MPCLAQRLAPGSSDAENVDQPRDLEDASNPRIAADGYQHAVAPFQPPLRPEHDAERGRVDQPNLADIEDNKALAGRRIIERLNPKWVPRQKTTFLLRVPNCERKHSE